jgi:hypothetical protein
MTPEATDPAGATSGGEEIITALFHELSQPLTILNCCLELSLRNPQVRGKHRRELRIALQQAQTITRLTTQLREVVDTGKPGRFRNLNRHSPGLPAVADNL